MSNVNPDKFICFVRFMIGVAKDKRCVPYYEIENIFGLGHKQVAEYAGALGDFCIWKKYPPLNRLIISNTNCKPSPGFDGYEKDYGKPWGEIIKDCWKHFRVTASKKKQVQDFSGIDDVVQEFLEE